MTKCDTPYVELFGLNFIKANYGFILIAISLAFLTTLPVLGQSEYSDAYTVDSSNNSYNPDTDTFNMGDNVPPLDLIGVGVSEASYDSNTYSTSTTTTLTTPSGANVVTNFSSGYSYARAEAFSLQLDPDTAEEGDYTVSSEHTYYQDSCYTPRDQTPMPCSPVSKLSKSFEPPFMKVSNTVSSAFNPILSSYYASYTSYSFFPISVRTYFNGYQYVGPGYARCGIASGTPPFGYRAYCDIRTPCQNASVCAAGVSPGIQVVALKIRYFFVSICYSKAVYVPVRPRCSPPAY
jgi:hypothetical protein